SVGGLEILVMAAQADLVHARLEQLLLIGCVRVVAIRALVLLHHRGVLHVGLLHVLLHRRMSLEAVLLLWHAQLHRVVGGVRVMAVVAVLRRWLVGEARFVDLIAQPGMAGEALLASGAVAKQKLIAGLVWLVADRAVSFEERIVCKFLERHVVTVVAGLFNRVCLQQKLGAGNVRLMAGGAAIFERRMLHRVRAGNGVAEGAGFGCIPLHRELVRAGVVVMTGIAGALGDRSVDLLGLREVRVTFG